MQPLFPEPAFVEYSVTLAVLDLHCATTVYPELCTLGFLQPSGLRSLPVCLWKVGVVHDFFCSWSRGPDKSSHQHPDFAGSTELCGREGKSHIFGHAATATHGLQSKRRWKLPGTFEPRGLEFRTECQTPDLLGPAPVALYNRLRTSRAKESNVPSSVRTMLLWYVTSAQLHPCSQTVFTKRQQCQAQHLEGWQRLRQHRAPGDHDK